IGASATLTISPTVPADAGRYRVVVTDACGDQVMSAEATLAVNCAGPTITQQPVGATLTRATNHTFSVLAGGTPPLSYRWFKDGAPVSNDPQHVMGATTADLVLQPAIPSDAG